MEQRSENKIVLVTRRSRLDELVQRFNTEGQARFYVEHLGADFSDYQREHQQYRQAVALASEVLSRHGRVQIVDRGFIPNFVFGAQDVVIALGQDGLVANVLKYLDGQPLLGVNPDPQRWDGVLLPFTVPELPHLMPDVLSQKRPLREITMAKAALNTGETLYGVNDLFIGPRSHTSARYSITSGDRSEQQSSSGIIVSTGLGSSGWMRSILAGASGIMSSISNIEDSAEIENFRWESNYLYFSVREPWPSRNSSAAISFGQVNAATPLRLQSQMPEHGVIFSDGIEADYIQFNAGTTAVITVADRKGLLVT